jgi:hypothetical protein
MRFSAPVLIAVLAGCPAAKTMSDAGSGDAGPVDSGPTYPAAYMETPFNSQAITESAQTATANLTFHDGPFSSVKLVIDLESPCFPWSKWTSNPPPSGQNYPAACDAFDRNLDFTLDPAREAGDPPGFNIVHAITPFGGPEQLTEDITDLANALPGSHVLSVSIPTYSDSSGTITGSNGMWMVTATIQATPGPAPHKVLAAIPLYEGSCTTPQENDDAGNPIEEQMFKSAEVAFSVPAGTTSARLEVRTSGHGGASITDRFCDGPAEEFCHRTLTVNIDDAALPFMNIYRTNCAALCTLTSGGPFRQYCAQNPCGDPQSVQASRANWCPGSETPPLMYDTAALHVAGMHNLSWEFSNIAAGGSAQWPFSAIYYAFGD